MRIQSFLPLRFRPSALAVLGLACLTVWSVAFPPARARAGSLVIPAWSFARGNVRIHASPDEYADAGPVVGPGPERPWGWTVEYDVDVPVTGTYTLQICYAAAEARPMAFFFDSQNMGKCCHQLHTVGRTLLFLPIRWRQLEWLQNASLANPAERNERSPDARRKTDAHFT